MMFLNLFTDYKCNQSFQFSNFYCLQGSLAWEPHHLQHAERPSDERVVTEREQAAAPAGETRFKGKRTGPFEATLNGLLTRPLAERLARCETLSALTAQSEPYGFLFIHLLSKQLVIQCPVETKQATLFTRQFYIGCSMEIETPRRSCSSILLSPSFKENLR